MKTFIIPWSKADSVMYAIGLAAMVASIFIETKQSIVLGALLTIVVIFLIGWLIASTPRSLSITEDELILRYWIGKMRIRRADIVSINHFTGSFGIRCFGYGGMLGMVGWFYTKELGLYRAYVSDPSNMFLLRTKTGRPILLSCKHSDELLSMLS